MLIDACSDTERLLTRRGASDAFTIAVERHDPRRGFPGERFDWSRYDAVLLDYDLGLNAETGLDWLGGLQARKGVPPVIVLSSINSATLAVQAMKLGSQDYLVKTEIDPARLGRAVANMVLERALPPPPRETEQTERLAELSLQPTSTAPHRDAREYTNEPLFRTAHIDPDADSDIKVPGYRVVEKIGEGGMSTVWLGERLEDGLKVVLKVLLTDTDVEREILGRFMQEYDLIGRLRNRSVVGVFERGFASAYAYIAMEHLPGGNLADRIRRGLTPDQAIDYLRQMANGLGAAHRLKIVHRDLKPRNVLFRDDGSLAIADFGVAKMMHELGWQTQSNALVGTPFYMSPEQCDGSPVDARSDLYSLGIILFEMLTGSRPFNVTSLAGLFHAHLHDPIPQLPGELPRFQPLVNGLLAKDPDERFQDVDDLFQGLEWVT
ncbi:MAG: protein kinase domain-containing protein [Chromatiales bacterium]